MVTCMEDIGEWNEEKVYTVREERKKTARASSNDPQLWLRVRPVKLRYKSLKKCEVKT